MISSEIYFHCLFFRFCNKQDRIKCCIWHFWQG